MSLLIFIMLAEGCLLRVIPQIVPVNLITNQIKTSDIVIHCDVFSEKRCLAISGLNNKTVISADSLSIYTGRLFTALATEGYPLACLDSVIHDEKRDDKKFHIYISAGLPLTVDQTFYTGDRIERRLPLKQGSVLSYSAFERKAMEILDDLTEEGFVFSEVSINPAEINSEQNQLVSDVSFNVAPGPIIRVADVEFPGAVQTRKSFLILETRIKKGDLLTRASLERADKRLKKLPFIDDVQFPQLVDAGPGLVVVNLPVTEKRVNQASGLLATASSADKLAGEFRLSFGNLFGTGRRLRFAWIGTNPNRSGVELSYREPWLMKLPLHLQFSLEQWSEDSLSTLTGFSVKTEWEPLDQLILSGKILQENVAKSDTLRNQNSQALWFSLGVVYDGLDSDWNPTSGTSGRIETAEGQRKWEGADRLKRKVRRETAGLESARRIRRNWIGYGSIAVEDVSGGGIIREDLLRLGGNGSLRGYAEESIISRGAVWGSVELRWRPDRQGYVGLFCDAGRIYRPDELISITERWPLSYGFSSALTTKAGLLRLDLGLASGETIRNARIHIRLATVF